MISWSNHWSHETCGVKPPIDDDPICSFYFYFYFLLVSTEALPLRCRKENFTVLQLNCNFFIYQVFTERISCCIWSFRPTSTMTSTSLEFWRIQRPWRLGWCSLSNMEDLSLIFFIETWLGPTEAKQWLGSGWLGRDLSIMSMGVRFIYLKIKNQAGSILCGARPDRTCLVISFGTSYIQLNLKYTDQWMVDVTGRQVVVWGSFADLFSSHMRLSKGSEIVAELRGEESVSMDDHREQHKCLWEALARCHCRIFLELPLAGFGLIGMSSSEPLKSLGQRWNRWRVSFNFLEATRCHVQYDLTDPPCPDFSTCTRFPVWFRLPLVTIYQNWATKSDIISQLKMIEIWNSWGRRINITLKPTAERSLRSVLNGWPLLLLSSIREGCVCSLLPETEVVATEISPESQDTSCFQADLLSFE